MLENAVDTIPYSRALKNKADQYKTQTGTPTSLTETMSDKIQTGYESIYVTFQNKKLVFFIGTDRRQW